jgi:uncharacterized membrane protein YeaQ/YmgE (transglycosylase-associated protein family)
VSDAADVGALLFGIVVGWVTYRTLVRSSAGVQLSDIATVIGAVGGAAVTGLFDSKHLFGLYAVGLAIGFFAYLIVFWILNGKDGTRTVMGDGELPRKFN